MGDGRWEMGDGRGEYLICMDVHRAQVARDSTDGSHPVGRIPLVQRLHQRRLRHQESREPGTCTLNVTCSAR